MGGFERMHETMFSLKRSATSIDNPKGESWNTVREQAGIPSGVRDGAHEISNLGAGNFFFSVVK